MSINKGIYDKIHNEYIIEDEIFDKDICGETHDKDIDEDKVFDKNMCDEVHDNYIDEYIDENKIFNKDICKDISDEIHAEYINKDKISNKFPKDNNKKMEDYSQPEQSKIFVNSKLKVDFDTKNKMIYLYPGKSQYFTVNVSKSCGDVAIRYKGYYTSKGICGNLGIYKIVQSGIVVETYHKLNPRKNDFLNFTAIDKCTKECYDFVVVFSCNLCGSCY